MSMRRVKRGDERRVSRLLKRAEKERMENCEGNRRAQSLVSFFFQPRPPFFCTSKKKIKNQKRIQKNHSIGLVVGSRYRWCTFSTSLRHSSLSTTSKAAIFSFSCSIVVSPMIDDVTCHRPAHLEVFIFRGGKETERKRISGVRVRAFLVVFVTFLSFETSSAKKTKT